jgi:hypothetical protein
MSNSEMLTVTKRGSKQKQQVPVITVDVAGRPERDDRLHRLRRAENPRAGPAGDTERISQEGRAAVEGYFQKLPREADHRVFVVTPKG